MILHKNMRIFLIIPLLMLVLVMGVPFSNAQSVPDWVKNTAGWWSTDAISETEFVNAIQFLENDGIIKVKSTITPTQLAELWRDGELTDEKFLEQVKNVSGEKYFEDGEVLDVPDWLINNAGWVSARIITNSNFNFDPTYLKEEIFPCEQQSTNVLCLEKTTNSYGLRGSEFSEKKNDVDFRIFAVGGSTTYGGGVSDNETWPSQLQQTVNENILDRKIEVINAGISGAKSWNELELVKNKLVNYQPDLIIIYDGWNDYNQDNDTDIVNNWKKICEIGNEQGFDTIIIVQPIASPGHRVITDQEIENMYAGLTYPEKSEQYVNGFGELDDVCKKTLDFRAIFDHIQEPIFWDGGHTMSKGNQVIAQNVFSMISLLYFEEYTIKENFDYEIESYDENTSIYAVGSDLSGQDFSNLDLTDGVFDKADLRDTNFSNSKIDGTRFVFASLDSSNIFEQNSLSKINFAGFRVFDKNLNGKDLSQANLSYVDLSNQDLDGVKLVGAKLSHAIFKTNSLNNKDLSQANLSHVDLSNQDLDGVDLSESILFRTNLADRDLRNISLDNANFDYSILSNSILSEDMLNDDLFRYTILTNIDFSEKILSKSVFWQAEFTDSDFSNVTFDTVYMQGVDFTKIKDKNLNTVTMKNSKIFHSDLTEVKLPKIIDLTIFNNAKMIKSDLYGSTLIGTVFHKSNLKDANLQNVNGGAVKQTLTINDAVGLSVKELKNKITEEPIISIQEIITTGNDVQVKFLIFNNFSGSILQNADLQNGSFFHAGFGYADLKNANLSNSNLSQTYLVGANLEGANLEGANLEGANLKCLNHEICE